MKSLDRIAMTCVAALLGLAQAPAGAAALYAFGPDALGVGRQFTEVTGGMSGGQATVGDGSVAFNGGLAYAAGSDTFYAVGNDSTGQSTLVSFSGTAPSAPGTSTALGFGFIGGLAIDTANSVLYAIASDFAGPATLYRMGLDGSGLTSLGALSSFLYGGLTFDSSNGLLYAFGADANGVIRDFDSIDVGGASPSVSTLFTLGDGSVAYNGGLAYDAADDLFYAIANDAAADSTLVTFGLGGAGTLSTVGAGLGQGFLNAGLAFGQASTTGGNPIPEPPTWALLGLAALAWQRVAARRPARR